MMGPARANSPIPAGSASSMPTRMEDSAMRPAPTRSRRARQAAMAGTTLAVMATMKEEGRL